MQRLLPIIFLVTMLSCTKENPAILKIAILDANFCLKNIASNRVRIIDQFETDTETFVNLNCSNLNFETKNHGYFVLDTFLKGLKSGVRVELYPINIFTNLGEQKEINWIRAFNYIKSKKINLIIMASAYLSESEKDSLNIETSIPIFAAAGTKKPFWIQIPYLWPQFSKLDNVIKIGHIFLPLGGTISHQPEIIGHSDTSLLETKSINYYVGISNQQQQIFSGSSYAVAKFSSIIVNFCYKNIGNSDINLLKSCIQARSLKTKTSDDRQINFIRSE